MPEQPTPRAPYRSRYGKSRYVSAAQFLAEVMCERRAAAEKKVLPPQFWKAKHWDAVFRQQVASANRLIARLDPGKTGTGARALSLFLKSEQGKRAYSLAAAWIVPHVEKIHAALLREPPPAATEATPAPAPVPRPHAPPPVFAVKKSVMAKLQELE